MNDLGLYFNSAEEANEWLSFDADPEEVERKADSDPDRTEEWRTWKESWDLVGND